MGMPWPSLENHRCSERGCPFPPVPGQTICEYHVQMFLFNESLTDDSLELDFTKDPNELPKSRVSIVSAAESKLTRWRERKERERERSLVCRVQMARLRRARRASRLCPCGRVLDMANRKTCSVCVERQQQRRRSIRAAGLCAACAKCPPAIGHILCARCRLKAKEYSRRHYVKVTPSHRKRVPAPRTKSGGLLSSVLSQKRRRGFLADSGRCVYCRKPALAAVKYCSECRGKQYRQQLERKRRFASAGLCQQCGKPPSPGRKMCSACVRKRNDVQLRIRRERKKAGLCTVCGKIRDRKAVLTCRSCADRQNRAKKKYRQTRRPFRCMGGG